MNKDRNCSGPDQNEKAGGNSSLAPIVWVVKPVFALLTASPRGGAFAQAHMFVLTLYLAIGISVITFDLGVTDCGKKLAEFGQSIIPSIQPTSQITSKPASSALVLSISWIWGVAFSVPFVWLLAKEGRRAINQVLLKKTMTSMQIAFVWVLFACGIYLLANEPIATAGGVEGYFLRGLEATPFCAVLWGMVILITVSAAFYVASVSLVCMLTKNIEEK